LLEKQFGTFDEFKNQLRDLYTSGKYKYDVEAIKEWSSFSDIPPKEVRVIIGLIN